MDIILPLLDPDFSFSGVNEETIELFQGSNSICFYKNEDKWMTFDDATVFNVSLEYGGREKLNIQFYTTIDELEMVVSALQKSIKMFRRDFPNEIKAKLDSGMPI